MPDSTRRAGSARALPFRASTGVPPHRYQLQLRVDQTKADLAAGQAPAQVAVSTGFVDQSHLHRHFTRYVGMAPGRYRSARAPRHAAR